MESQLTVRISDDLDRDISSLSKRLRLKRSDIIRMALEKFIEEFRGEEERSPYDQVKNLIGSISSGNIDLGEAHRQYLLKRFKKHG